MKLFHSFAFALIYLREVVVSTFRLALLVLHPKLQIAPRFVEVPLDLRGEMPRFLFACLISMTPGSLSVGLDHSRAVLIVHLLDAPDPDAAVREMKAVFEQPLIRIFGRG
jgi:multisubunit Na+/H+ antiporter MnhE subunit